MTPKKISEKLFAQNKCVEEAPSLRSLTVHELKKLVDNRFQKLPVGAKKPWVLAYNIHDIGGDDRLVIFPSLLLTQSQQVLEFTHTNVCSQMQSGSSILDLIHWKL